MKPAFVALAAGMLLLPTAEASAQSAGAFATEQCQRAVSDRARSKYNVDRAQFLGYPSLKQVSNAETGVSGRGQLDTRRGWVPFSYRCTFNYRTEKTSNISITSNLDSGSGSGSGDNTAGKVVGAIIGAAIAGAIINSVDQNGHDRNDSKDSGWWSPEPGVQCNSYQSACYKNGRFSAHWTDRIYD